MTGDWKWDRVGNTIEKHMKKKNKNGKKTTDRHDDGVAMRKHIQSSRKRSTQFIKYIYRGTYNIYIVYTIRIFYTIKED